MPRLPPTSRSSAHRTSVLAGRASEVRHAPTASEARLWDLLRGGQLGAACRRQVPLLGRFIADFFAPEVRLVVEVDGEYHTRRGAVNALRDRALARAGCSILRLDAKLVMADIGAAAAAFAPEIERQRGA